SNENDCTFPSADRQVGRPVACPTDPVSVSTSEKPPDHPSCPELSSSLLALHVRYGHHLAPASDHHCPPPPHPSSRPPPTHPPTSSVPTSPTLGLGLSWLQDEADAQRQRRGHLQIDSHTHALTQTETCDAWRNLVECAVEKDDGERDEQTGARQNMQKQNIKTLHE
ncbi:unnamed protein product, partial [Protopolystoma xenopodis]